MKSSTRVAAYAAVLGLVFLGALGIGRAVGPVGRTAPAHQDEGGHGEQHRGLGGSIHGTVAER